MRIYKINVFWALVGTMALLVSCQFSEQWDDPVGEQIPIALHGDINQLAVTRASDNGFAAGDEVGIWAVNYEGDTPGTLALKNNQATNVRFTFDGNSTWTPDYDIYYKDRNTKVDIYGCYPYSSAISSIEAWPFEVQEDQSTVSAHGLMGGYEASDFLWVKRVAVTPTASAIQLLFQHKMSCVVVTLVKGTGFAAGEFESMSQSVLINNVRRNATINLATGAVTATGGISARSTVPAAYDNGFRAIVVPQTVASANSLFSITLGGVPYTYSEGAAFTYIAGKQHNFAVTINKKADGGYDVTVNTTISAWTNDNASHDFTAKEYVVVNVGTPGTLGETLTNAGKNPDAIKYLKVLGTVNADDFYYMRDHMAVLQGVNMQESKVWEEKIPDNAFEGHSLLNSFVFPDGRHNNMITEIGVSAFNGTLLTGSVVIPEGVQYIRNEAFSGNRITHISFPSTLESIGGSAFSSCSLLTGSLDLPSAIKSIGGSAFYDCGGLSGVLSLPNSLEEIGSAAFRYCSGFVGDIVIPPSITVIHDGTFDRCTGISRLILHEGVTRIENEAFKDCSNLKGELILPESLQYIGPWAFANCLISGQLCLPESLLTIGWNAFSGCGRLSGILTIPSSLSYINGSTFAGCSNIEGIVLPASIDVIESGAFCNCFAVSSIVSYAPVPPSLIGDVFGGIAKDNFTLEVPESSVIDYTYASGWNEFKRIAAHHEFSISRRLFRTLNSTESRDYILRAESGASWSIESKPDWVTVSPASGTGKTDVRVSVSALSPGSANRDGEVVFLLDGKNYRSTLKVEQYNYTYADGSVLTEKTHSKGNGIPLVFLGDCYDAADIAVGNYLADTREAISYFFDIEPYKSYQDYFDVYIVFGQSEDSGVGSVNTIRTSKFGTQYSLTSETLENGGAVAFEYARKADAGMDLTKSLVVMVLNSADYGGLTYMWGDGSAIAICPKSTDPYPYDFRGLVQHEAGGHGFGKLADEYIYVNAFIQKCGCSNPHLAEFLGGKLNGWYKNLSETSDRNSVPWSHLMYHPSYANTVDIYEGGFFHTRGIFRSEPNSCMNNNIPYYSAISRQAIVERIMDYAGLPFNLEDFYTNDAAALATKSSNGAFPSWAPSNASNYKHHEPILMGDHPNLK